MPIVKPLKSLNLNFTLFILAMVRLTSLQNFNFQIHTTCWLKFAFQYICMWRLAGCALGLETTALTIRNKLISWQKKCDLRDPVSMLKAHSTSPIENWPCAARAYLHWTSVERKSLNCAAAIIFGNPSNLWYYAGWFCMNFKITEQILEATPKCIQNRTLL